MPLKSGGAVESEYMRGRSNQGLTSISKGVQIPTTILDLSFPNTSTDVDVTYRSGIGRKCFYANGLFWVFYSDGTNMVYRTSEDGVTWSSPTTIRACDTSHNFAVWFDGSHLHYAATPLSNWNEPVVYRRGIPNDDGSITWSTAEQTVRQDANMWFRNITLAVDSGGYPWIGMATNQRAPLTVGTFADVSKSSKNDGVWMTQTGFPYRPDTTVNKRDILILVPLTSQKMYIIYVLAAGPATNPINGKLWAGSIWDLEETATSRQSHDASISAVAYQDIVHVVYDERTTNVVYHLKRAAGPAPGSWTETQIMATSEGSGWSLTVQVETGYLWLFYIINNDVLYRQYISEWDASPTTLQDRTAAESPYSMNSYYRARSDGKLGVIWTESPAYTIAHSGLV